ncbi:MAG TPA: MarC family protein, partial [Methanoregulaceae archaeon]|nr:MarC family protein [Methanoregulaceae archaeon]
HDDERYRAEQTECDRRPPVPSAPARRNAPQRRRRQQDRDPPRESPRPALPHLFLFFNFFIFDTLGITLASFQVAGGILPFLLGLQMALGIDIGKTKEHTPTAAGVIIGTPLLCGPGTITTVLLLSEENGMIITALAIALVLAATWVVLRFSFQIQKLLGNTVTEILAKILGMLVAAIAVSIVADGIIGLLQDYGTIYSFSLNVK